MFLPFFPLTMWCVLFTAAEWKGPTAGLKPRFPQNLFPCQLVRNAVYICSGMWLGVIGCLLGLEGLLMSLHSFGSLREDFSVSRLGTRGQRAGLRWIVEEVIHKRRVVVRHMFSETHADLGVIAPTGPQGGKVWSEKVHLEDGFTWKETQYSFIYSLNSVIFHFLEILLMFQ